jgi:dipeptidyl-peptidase-3
MYSTGPKERQLAFSDKGVTTYYSCNCVKKDLQLIQQFMTEKSLEPYNTRVFKRQDKDGRAVYDLRLASAVGTCDPCDAEDTVAAIAGEHVFQDVIINVTRGDYAPLMAAVVENLMKARDFAANEIQEQMLDAYVRSFKTGSLTEHKKGSSFWIRDKGPIVESYIGFIESYRDPFGVRGEWEGTELCCVFGFVSVVAVCVYPPGPSPASSDPHLYASTREWEGNVGHNWVV